MSAIKGFTLIELITVMAIVGAVATFSIPNYLFLIEQGEAKSAENNIRQIIIAQQSYYFQNNGHYCGMFDTALMVSLVGVPSIISILI